MRAQAADQGSRARHLNRCAALRARSVTDLVTGDVRDHGSHARSTEPALMAACGHEAGEPGTVPIDPIAYDAVFVVNGTDNSIAVIDTTTDEVRGTIELLEVDYPHHIYLSADRGTLLVAVPGSDLSAGHGGGGGHGGAPAGAVLALDATTGALRLARRLPSPNHNAVFAPDGTVWTSQISSPGKVLILDPTTLETGSEVMVDDGPSEVTFAPSGTYGFVANTDSDSVTVLDAATGAIVDTLPVGDAPVGAWPGTDGRMYVDNEAGESISVIDPSTPSIAATFALGFTPALAAIAPGIESRHPGASCQGTGGRSTEKLTCDRAGHR